MKSNKKKKLIIYLSISVVIIVAILGITYAYFSTIINGNNNEQSVNVTTVDLEVTYVDGDFVDNKKYEPGYIGEKKFSVTNTGTGKAYYSISLENVVNTFTRGGDWTLDLIRNHETIISGMPVPHSDTNITYVEEIEAGATNEYILNTIYTNLRVNQSDDMNARLAFKVNIIDAVEEPEMFKNATEGTLLKEIGKHNIIQEPLTTPGKNTLSEETVLASAEDDYGTSYYFRGRVPNNYVTIDNTCWMILRILGNGNIKLVLADGNKSCGIDNGYDWKDGTSGLLNNAQPYTYGNTIDFETSNIYTQISSWLSDKGLIHRPYQTTGEWCLDTSKETFIGGTSTTLPILQYTSQSRLNTSNPNPTLKCNATPLYIEVGTLTADEIAFAGGSLESPSEPSWININADSTWWWTMTPSGIEGNNTVWNFMGNWMQLNNNGNVKIYTGNKGGAIRPVIIMSASTPVTSGNGSLNMPYIIQ